MRSTVIRADGSSRLGMGHIMRSLIMADGLKAAGAAVLFVTKAFEPQVREVIRSNGHDVEGLPPGLSAKDDAQRTCAAARRVGAGLVVTDLCHQPVAVHAPVLRQYHRWLSREFFVVLFAGGTVTDFPAQVVVHPYVQRDYPEAGLGGTSRWLLGPLYCVFRREFIAAVGMSRTIAETGRRILVTVGGSDELHVTTRILRALALIPRDDLSVRVAIGPAYSDALRREIAEESKRLHAETTLLSHGANMAEAMWWADLAITGDGLTKYETALMGTPSIMLSRFNSERDLNEAFESAGTTLHLGDASQVEPTVLAEAVQGLLANASLRRAMSQRGQALVDPHGLARILSAIPRELLS